MIKKLLITIACFFVFVGTTAASTYNWGETVPIQFNVLDTATGTLIAADAITIEVFHNNGATIRSETAMTQDSSGIYYYNLTAPDSTIAIYYKIRWRAQGQDHVLRLGNIQIAEIWDPTSNAIVDSLNVVLTQLQIAIDSLQNQDNWVATQTNQTIIIDTLNNQDNWIAQQSEVSGLNGWTPILDNDSLIIDQSTIVKTGFKLAADGLDSDTSFANHQNLLNSRLDVAVSTRSTLSATDNIGVNFDDISGTLDSNEIGSDFLNQYKIATDAIGASEIAENAIGSSEIAANAITVSEAPNLDAAISSRSTFNPAADSTILYAAQIDAIITDILAIAVSDTATNTYWSQLIYDMAIAGDSSLWVSAPSNFENMLITAGGYVSPNFSDINGTLDASEIGTAAITGTQAPLLSSIRTGIDTLQINQGLIGGTFSHQSKNNDADTVWFGNGSDTLVYVVYYHVGGYPGKAPDSSNTFAY